MAVTTTSAMPIADTLFFPYIFENIQTAIMKNRKRDKNRCKKVHGTPDRRKRGPRSSSAPANRSVRR